jgi:DNA-binding CsgD family transcriptional regulator
MPHAVTASSSEAVLAGRVVARLRAFTGAEVAFAAVLDPAGAWFRIGQLAGTRTARLAEIASYPGVGVGGRCIQLRQPVQVNDYVSARSITHEFDAAVSTEGLRAVFAVPFWVGGALRGAVYGAARRPGRYGERMLSAAADLADIEAPSERTAADYRDRVQEAHAHLRGILATVQEPALRHRLAAVSDLLCGQAEDSLPSVQLSPREVDILAAASLGYRNDEIARELALSVLTVKSYLKSAMGKLNSRNRTEAVRLARRLGYLP